MYDWANSAFALIVMAGFFPVLLKGYWADGMSVNESSFWLGIGNAVAALIVTLLSPFLGVLADESGSRKQMLLLFTAIGVVMTATLYLVAQGDWQWAIVIYVLASIAHAESKPFYNALLLNVTDLKNVTHVSTLGYALGYVGGGLLLAFDAWMIMQPAFFGFADKVEAIRLAFVLVAVWWALFSLPIFLFVPEGNKKPLLSVPLLGWRAWSALKTKCRRIAGEQQLWFFLLAYWFYIGAVGTLSRMAVDYGLSLGFGSGAMIIALLVSQLVAFPAALCFGWLGTRYRERPAILACIVVYILVCFALYKVETAVEFYLLAGLIGSVLGGVQALSRSYYARMISQDESAGMFGFYNTATRSSLVLGPAMMGLMSLLTSDTRFSIIAVIIPLVIGGLLLAMVRDHTRMFKEAE